MRKDFVGSFYFKKTISGNLIGEFLNNDSPIINVEGATVVKSKGGFEGTYNSIWYDSSIHNATLTISKSKNKYLIKWIDKSSLNYEGQAMIVDNILTGYYRVKP